MCRKQWYAGECLTTGSPARKVLISKVCLFPWCRHSTMVSLKLSMQHQLAYKSPENLTALASHFQHFSTWKWVKMPQHRCAAQSWSAVRSVLTPLFEERGILSKVASNTPYLALKVQAQSAQWFLTWKPPNTKGATTKKIFMWLYEHSNQSTIFR